MRVLAVQVLECRPWSKEALEGCVDTMLKKELEVRPAFLIQRPR